jgi:hypothetical protein
MPAASAAATVVALVGGAWTFQVNPVSLAEKAGMGWPLSAEVYWVSAVLLDIGAYCTATLKDGCPTVAFTGIVALLLCAMAGAAAIMAAADKASAAKTPRTRRGVI